MQEQEQKQNGSPVRACIVAQAGRHMRSTGNLLRGIEESCCYLPGYLAAIPKRLEGSRAKEPLAVDCCGWNLEVVFWLCYRTSEVVRFEGEPR